MLWIVYKAKLAFKLYEIEELVQSIKESKNLKNIHIILIEIEWNTHTCDFNEFMEMYNYRYKSIDEEY